MATRNPFKLGLAALALLLSAGIASGMTPAAHVAGLLARGDAAKQALKYSEAFDWYLKAADLGDPRAEVEVGEMYALGRGVKEDQTKALSWYRKAAEQGDANGEAYVGVQYENGWGIAQDYGQALVWYRKSADHGDPVAAEAVGMMYDNGLGVPADFTKARVWFEKAIAGGDTLAEAPLCSPDQLAWSRVALGTDLGAMNRVIANIDPYCKDLLTHAKARRNEVERANPTDVSDKQLSDDRASGGDPSCRPARSPKAWACGRNPLSLRPS